MQPITAKSSEINTSSSQIIRQPVLSENASGLKLENKAEQAIISKQKVNDKLKNDTDKSVQTDTKLAQKKSESVQIDKKIDDTQPKDAKRDRNIAETKIAEARLDTKEANANTRLQEKTATATLEANKNYTKGTTDESQNLNEISYSKQKILESVKSVKADGTETYYFPVPVEILTQLPPPGNIGISAARMNELVNATNDSVADAKDKKDMIDIQKHEPNEDSPIKVSSRTNTTQPENSPDAPPKSAYPDNTSPPQGIDYGLG